MDPFTSSFLSRVAASLATGMITGTGRWARDKLGTPEREKALGRCNRAGLEALVRSGVPEDAEHREHVGDVIEEFFRTPAPQLKLLERLRGRAVEATDLAELFADECDPETLSEPDLVRGFHAFLEAFEGQAIEESALQEVLRTGHAVEGSRLKRQEVAAQEDVARAVREQPEIAEKARREAARRQRSEEIEEAERAYLLWMRREWQLLPLVVLGGEKGPKEGVTLDDVYVELDTTHRVEIEGGREGEAILTEMPGRDMPGRDKETRPWSALEAAAAHERLVLLGDPGSGKSTFTQELLARLASARLGEGEVPEGFGEPRLPVLILLRDLSRRLSTSELPERPQRERERALAETVRGEALAVLERFRLGDFEEGLGQAWDTGHCLVALDGLDEVPPDQRAVVREAVLAASRENGGPGRMLVTCRIRSYRGDAELAGFSAFTLAPFDEDKIRRFSLGWYRAQSADERTAEERGEELANAALAPALRELAANPMLLTTMALVHQKNVGLPRERVRLYDEAVKVLLVRWQKEKPGTEALEEDLEELLADERRLRRVLERLAFEAHRVGGTEREQAAGLARGRILTLLEDSEYLGDADPASRFVDYVDQRAGLLVGRGGSDETPESYSFPHRTFQEYLAGCHLVSRRKVVREYFARAGEGDLWSVAAELGAEALLFVRDNLHGLLDLAYGLCPAEAAESEQQKRALLWSGKAAAVVGREDIERDTAAPLGGNAYLKRLSPRLVELLRSDLPPVERAEAGRVLGKLRDPRKEVASCLAMEMCRVPAGDFWWGGGHDYLGAGETPWEKRSVARPYWISRYPVTQAQFVRFAEAGGYRDERFWTEARDAGVWEPGKITDWAGDISIDGPEEYGEVFSLANHPVVGVTWYEALAFTRWLTEELRRRGGAKGWEVRLPSEEEWEKAARGGLDLPSDRAPRQTLETVASSEPGRAAGSFETTENSNPRRVYPWGDEISVEHANYDDTGIGATSAVGCFPLGTSPYGCEEMSGNVWEWCRDVRRGEASERHAAVALRGGSWAGPARVLAAAFRLWGGAWYRDRSVGFRVVLLSVSEHA